MKDGTTTGDLPGFIPYAGDGILRNAPAKLLEVGKRRGDGDVVQVIQIQIAWSGDGQPVRYLDPVSLEPPQGPEAYEIVADKGG